MSEKIESPKKNNNSNNNDYLTKLAVLRNAIIDERKKREEIEKKLIKLEEDKKLIQKENDEIKIDNTMKGELIEKLKLELRNYRNKNGQKGVQRFLKNLFEEEEEIHADEKQENDIKEDQISFLKKENDELKNKQSILEDEKKTLNIKLNEQIGENDKLKKDYEKKILEVKNSNIDKIVNLEKELKEKNNLINVFSERNQYFTNYTKTFDTQKTNFENEINKLKNEVNELKEINNNKDKILSDLIKDQQNLLHQIDEANKEKDDFKMLINEYKRIIQELTPLNIDHDFIGYILPEYEDQKKKRIECNFGKVNGGLYLKIENKQEVILCKNDIKDIILDEKFSDRIKIILCDNKELICQFSSKEVKFFKQFYIDLKNKPNVVEKALMKISFGDYLY
jgi:chromosome segregation ATPase